MVYSDVVEKGYILPKKDKYTMRDVNNLIVESLFHMGNTLTLQEALFIVKCSAIYHDTDYSKAISKPINNSIINL